MNFKQRIQRNLINIPGWRTNRKIVVLESDDWGSIRMPSKKIFNSLTKRGYNPEQNAYLSYDALESESDLIRLFEVLSSVKDNMGNSAILTANAVVANPNFEKILQSNFSEYYYEPITETFNRYPRHSRSFALWKEGVKNKLFYPQFHGREHLNVDQWMIGLRNNDKLLHEAFRNRMISISSMPSKLKFNYMEGLDFFSEKEKNSKKKILIDGMHLFRELTGYISKSFIANCYVWEDSHEQVLSELGVQYIQGTANQIRPRLKDSNHKHEFIYHYLGQKNRYNQRYLIRNVFFEPILMKATDTVGECMQRIAIAFKWKKPAIISSHRLNFIGFINSKKRDENLTNLSHLLQQITYKWPDVEFMTSDQLGDLINK